MRHRSPNGAPQAFVNSVLAMPSWPTECIDWPFAKSERGYAVIGQVNVHRVVCDVVNGPCPDGLEACHSCGRGNLGCINPAHLRWGTRQENAVEREAHRVARGGRHPRSVLTDDAVAEIKRRYVPGVTRQVDLAAEFGVSQVRISQIIRGQS